MEVIKIGSYEVEVDRKEILNAHLGVYPPNGRIRVAAPLAMSNDSVRLLVISRLAWIKQQIKEFESQRRESKREFLSGESHYLWGVRYLLDVVISEDKPSVQVRGNQLQLAVPQSASWEQKASIMDDWYRQELRSEATKFLVKWKQELQLLEVDFEVRKMKTRWGSCLPSERKFHLNADLAKQPYHSLEYVIVHELLHFKVPEHNDEFFKLLGKNLPNWRSLKEELNYRLPYVQFEENPLDHITNDL